MRPQHAKARLTAWERIELLLEPGSRSTGRVPFHAAYRARDLPLRKQGNPPQ